MCHVEHFSIELDTSHQDMTCQRDCKRKLKMSHFCSSCLELEKQLNAKKEWNEKPVTTKLSIFLAKKFGNVQIGIWQIYFALSTIFEVGHGENIEDANDEL